MLGGMPGQVNVRDRLEGASKILGAESRLAGKAE